MEQIQDDHMLGHKTSLSKFKIKIISSIFYDHNVETRNQLQGKKLKKTQTHGD